ncbi:MAG: DUF2811 domain-containing protein [Prochlorococcaceae cyanobacterium]
MDKALNGKREANQQLQDQIPQQETRLEAEDPEAGRISLEAEVPEVLFDGMREFIQNHPQWDQYSVITSALAGFLFQNGCQDHSVSQHYIDGLFVSPSAS